MENQDLNLLLLFCWQEFYKVVAMDLKNFQSHIVIHLHNHVARFSDTAVMKSEDRNEIINHLFSVWISIFGTL